MFESWFARLFKFDPINFSEGTIGFQAGSAVLPVLLLVVLLVGAFGAIYYVTNLYSSDRSKALSFGLRGSVLALLCLPLFEPVLIMPDVVPDENFVAVLVDASESMNVPDGQRGGTRRDDVQHLLFDEDGGILPGLEESFKLRYYTFGREPLRVDSLRAVAAAADETNLSAALRRLLDDFKGLPLAGVVLLTDGGDNSTGVPLREAEELRSLGIPLHIVGFGRERFEQEREILEATVGRGVEETTAAEIDLKVRSWNREEAPVTFNLYRGDQLVHTEQRVLKGEGKIDQLTLFYEPQEKGAFRYTLRVEEAPSELNTANNALDLLIDTRRDTIRVLYFEGHLRRDFKFIKRALDDDEVVEFTSISRTGTGKFYRQGLRRPDELAGGLPKSEEELHAYKAVILGDIEASAFSPVQLQLLERFVRIRGGGFLMLGGRTTFAEGDYWNTPVADLLPVELDLSRRTVIPPEFADPEAPPEGQGFRFVPTPAGLESPILKFSAEPEVNRARWGEMPGLTSLSYLGAVKPGALVLAEKPEDTFGAREPLLVTQRYGKGRSAALATASTWRWQMQLDAEDMRHERFWRQLIRWLATSAPNRVHLDLAQQRFAPGEEIQMAAQVYGPGYAPLDGAAVEGLLTDPSGTVREIAFQPMLSEAGTYTAAFVPPGEGVYEFQVAAEEGGAPVGTHTLSFLVQRSGKEYQNAVLKRTFLENLAAANDGYYYSPEKASVIPAHLRGRRTSTSIFRAEYLWDMPFLFGLILVLLSAEWIYRRRKGLP